MKPPKNERFGSPAQVRAVDRNDRTIDIVASDFSKDSYNSRIDPAGWDFDQFRANPIILLSHNDRTFPAANAIPETVRVENGKVMMRIKFPDRGKYEEADIAFELYSDGFMRGVSVGFVPLEWEDIDEEGEEVRIYRRARLLEVSLVTIPSNDNALAQRAEQLNQNIDEVRARAEKLEHMMETHIDSGEFAKYKSYFERKQPVNKVASKIMEKFFAVRGMEQPADEFAAFTRMSEIIEEEAKEKPTENEEEPTKNEEPKEEPKEETEIAEVAEEITETPPQEAPATEQTDSVRIPISVLKDLPGTFMEAAVEAAVKASRQGIPVNQIGAVVDALGAHVLSHISNPSK